MRSRIAVLGLCSLFTAQQASSEVLVRYIVGSQSSYEHSVAVYGQTGALYDEYARYTGVMNMQFIDSSGAYQNVFAFCAEPGQNLAPTGMDAPYSTTEYDAVTADRLGRIVAAWTQLVNPVQGTIPSAPGTPNAPLYNTAAAWAVWEVVSEVTTFPWSVSTGSGNLFIDGTRDYDPGVQPFTSAQIIDAANFFLGDLSSYDPVMVRRLSSPDYQDLLVWDMRLMPEPGKALLGLAGMLPLLARRRR